MNKPLLAFHGDKKIKAKYQRRVAAHAKADAIVKGQYWADGKGCAVGCTIHSGHHSAYESELGIPVALAYLEDKIFEGLPNAKAMKWPARFLSAIKPSADLSGVSDKFLAWMVRDVLRFAKTRKSIKAITAVADLYDRKIAGDAIDLALWVTARSNAATAAADATAYDAAYATARGKHYVLMSDKLIELLKEAK